MKLRRAAVAPAAIAPRVGVVAEGTSAVRALAALIAVSTFILFGSAALRHALFQSTAFDLGIFDQAVFLISRGEVPYSSFLGFHILGDHGAWVVYPMALLYAFGPSPYWLLLLQAVVLSLGAWPAYLLARDAGLERRDALLFAAVYLLYPVVYNQSVADFHPDVIAVPALLTAVLAARRRRPLWFAASLALALACKEIVGLTVASMGLWLWLREDRRAFGTSAVVAGGVWFAAMTLFALPALTGVDAGVSLGDERYAYLGGTLGEILHSVAEQPAVVLGRVVSIGSLVYLLNLALPVLWGLVPRYLAPLLGAAPSVLLNLASSWSRQRSVTNQYSLQAVPFLLLAVLAALAGRQTWIRDRRFILAWGVVGFLIFARYARLVDYAQRLQTARVATEALGLIPPGAGVLTDNCLATHLAQRRHIYLVGFQVTPAVPSIPSDVDFVVLDLQHPCSVDSSWLAAWQQGLGDAFAPQLRREGMVVLRRISPPAPEV